MADQGADDRDTAGVTGFAQALEHLLCGVGMLVKQANDFRSEVIQLGGATGWFACLVARALEPDSDGAGIKIKLARDLGDREAVASAELVDELIGVEVDHAAPPPEPSTARRMSPAERSSPERGDGATEGASRPRIW